MEGLRRRGPAAWLPLLLFLLLRSFDFCSSLGDEGTALLRFRKGIEVDPYAALSDWVTEEHVEDPCGWRGSTAKMGRSSLCKNLKDLHLKGTLVPELGQLSHLRYLILRNNSFHGVVPREMEELRNLEVLDLAHNNFSGVIPSSLGNIPSLELLLVGGNPLLGNAPPELHNLFALSEVEKKPRGKISKALIFGLVGAAVGSAVLVAVGIFCYRSNKVVAIKPWATGLSGQLQKAFVTGVTQLGRPELEAACEDFSNIIGTLSDSMLYKGTLSSGVEIAVASTVVNSAKDWSELYEGQFRKKIGALSKVNHKNFSNLLGYCEEEEPFTRMMVFEYAPNGTLHELLHGSRLAKRLRVMMGIAYCLDYMNQLTSPVVLGNLTSTSVYLTDDFAAKVSDFEFWSETAAAAPPPASTSGPLGELARRPDVHPEEVVFKFGMLLLEIISGRPPVLTWASDYLKGVKPAIDLVDGNLKSFKEEEVAAICEVVVGCCNPMPAARPAMAEVVARLRTITGLAPEAATPRAPLSGGPSSKSSPQTPKTPLSLSLSLSLSIYIFSVSLDFLYVYVSGVVE
ncbi:unnamed protein product [Spirodela intermedia]|uniref:Protein kinase domain-containing protein n=1 Tax=Spirodela intermedia TaxID=51605 RepID=A0A7I8IVN1_SPIIN|nr:unnamed protein product [Spirodela intermedia]CAA6661840.1 unnamed protein product [Spirodela intermedia]